MGLCWRCQFFLHHGHFLCGLWMRGSVCSVCAMCPFLGVSALINMEVARFLVWRKGNCSRMRQLPCLGLPCLAGTVSRCKKQIGCRGCSFTERSWASQAFEPPQTSPPAPPNARLCWVVRGHAPFNTHTHTHTHTQKLLHKCLVWRKPRET